MDQTYILLYNKLICQVVTSNIKVEKEIRTINNYDNNHISIINSYLLYYNRSELPSII